MPRYKVTLSDKENAVDFVHVLQYTSDVLYPTAEIIVLVTDNLNTHTYSSLYMVIWHSHRRKQSG